MKSKFVWAGTVYDRLFLVWRSIDAVSDGSVGGGKDVHDNDFVKDDETDDKGDCENNADDENMNDNTD